MNPWEGVTSQMLGAGLGQAGELVDYQQRAYGAGMAYNYPLGDYIQMDAATTTSNALYVTDDMTNTFGQTSVKIEEPPDEFTQLSNHKFHELLGRFSEST